MLSLSKEKIWIDLDNSPHVPFFRPIIRELENRGYSVLITARDRFQVCDLAGRFKMKYIRVGRYYGKNKMVKMFWLTLRAIQLIPLAIKNQPRLALSHGSRSQLMTAKILGIPSITIFDYEYAKGIPFFRSTWRIAPEIIYEMMATTNERKRLLKYPGIKEDVYLPYFEPDSKIKDELGINGTHIIVTIRPPATEAHYFDAKSEKLFELAMDFLSLKPNLRMILLPRNDKQKGFIQKRWSKWYENGKIIIPDHAVDGLNLLWHSDLVISGGGTMNREAAGLGVPVYSIFRGKIGAVDRYLSEKGRLTLIENEGDLDSKIILKKRNQSFNSSNFSDMTLQKIVSSIVGIIQY